MKKILGLILVLAGLSFALAPAASTALGVPSITRDQVISATLLDTVKGWTGLAKDSLTVLSNFKPIQGYEYFLVRDVLTGGTDSIKIRVVVICNSFEGRAMYAVDVDSFTTAAGECIALPIGNTLFGGSYTIKLYGYAANSIAGVILNRVSIYRRQVTNITKQWQGW